MSVFLVNDSDKTIKFMRNAKVINFLAHQRIPVVSREVAEDIAFNNPGLRVVEQDDEEQYFLRHSGPNVIVVRYENTTFPFPNHRYVEVETREKAQAIADEFNNASHSAVRFTVHTASELIKDNVDNKEIILLNAADKVLPIE